MIAIPMHADFSENRERIKGDTLPCVVCGRACKNPVWMLHLWGGNDAVTEDEASTLNPNADMGMYPVGSDCLRKHPELKPYAIRQ